MENYKQTVNWKNQLKEKTLSLNEYRETGTYRIN